MKRLLLLAVAGLFAGCTTEGTTTILNPVTVVGDGIERREIHIDAFSHFWLSLKLGADTIVGNTLYFGTGEDQGTYVLVDTSMDKISGLPAHVTDSLIESFNGGQEIFYPVPKRPRSFACFLRAGSYLSVVDSLNSNEVYSSSYWYEGVIYVDHRGQDSLSSQLTRFAYCEYVVGKGFRVDPYAELGTYIIQYTLDSLSGPP